MEYLEVRNFGPIREVVIEIKELNILIGTTSSGKSTIAKLICIFNSSNLIDSGEMGTFKELLKDYNIDFEIKGNTYIKYSRGDYHWILENNKFSDNYPFKGLASFLLPPLSLSTVDQLVGNLAKGLGQRALFRFLIVSSFLSSNKIEPETGDIAKNPKAKEITEQLAQAEKLKNLFNGGDYAQLEKVIEVVDNIHALLKQEFEIFNPLYIPAERTILSMIAESVFGLLNNDISLAKSMKEFGAKFETARKELKKVNLDILNAKYHYTDKTNFITLNDGTELKLEQASSGFQSLTPLYLVIEHFVDKNSVTRSCVTVEEPELNLYPTHQKKLVEFLVGKTKSSGDKLIITTHSPYVVTTIDNLVQAGNVAAAKPESKEEIAGLVSPDLWLDYNNISCYFFDNGSCRSTLDAETQSIGPSNLDDVSTQIGEAYERMLELKYS